MRSHHIVRLSLFAGVLTLAACQEMDPYTRPGTWQPTGANAGNIAAMVADPYDLIRGRPATRVDSKASDLAVGRLWTDKPKPLPDPGGPGGSGSGGGSGGGGGGGGSGG
ncbi:MAG: hypothetical protein WDN25_05465 [Acetobacteraceae bacterium]